MFFFASFFISQTRRKKKEIDDLEENFLPPRWPVFYFFAVLEIHRLWKETWTCCEGKCGNGGRRKVERRGRNISRTLTETQTSIASTDCRLHARMEFVLIPVSRLSLPFFSSYHAHVPPRPTSNPPFDENPSQKKKSDDPHAQFLALKSRHRRKTFMSKKRSTKTTYQDFFWFGGFFF